MDLSGDRILLRELKIQDWEAVHRVTSRPEVSRYQPWGPNTAEETLAYVQECLRRAEENPRQDYTLAAVMRETGDLIGYASLWLRSQELRSGEIGFFLHSDSWGQGLGTEVATLLLRCAFEHLHLHRVFATCDPRNKGSAHVLQKIGMTHEGRLQHTMLIRDGWRDSDVFAIVAPEWEAARHTSLEGEVGEP